MCRYPKIIPLRLHTNGLLPSSTLLPSINLKSTFVFPPTSFLLQPPFIALKVKSSMSSLHTSFLPIHGLTLQRLRLNFILVVWEEIVNLHVATPTRPTPFWCLLLDLLQCPYHPRLKWLQFFTKTSSAVSMFQDVENQRHISIYFYCFCQW